MRRDLSRRRELPWAQRRLLVEAALWLAVFRVALRIVPFARTAALLRLSQTSDSHAGDDSAGRSTDGGQSNREDAADTIGWAVASAAAHAPWHSSCLVQSLAGHVILRNHHLSSVVYLGVAKSGDGDFLAHGWLRCGSSGSRHGPPRA